MVLCSCTHPAVAPAPALLLTLIGACLQVLANCAVARRVAEVWPEAALLRLHPQPEESKFGALARALEQQGMPFRASGARELAASLSLGVNSVSSHLPAVGRSARAGRLSLRMQEAGRPALQSPRAPHLDTLHRARKVLSLPHHPRSRTHTGFGTLEVWYA